MSVVVIFRQTAFSGTSQFFTCVSLHNLRGALMSDAMILPCGHTFGAGGIEQVKQMVQSLCLSFTLFYLFSFAYGICFFFGCVLLESLLHLFAASLRRLYHPKSQ